MFTYLDELPPEAERTKQFLSSIGIKSSVSVPITVAASLVGAFVIQTTRTHRAWPDDIVPMLRLFGEVFANALARKRSEESLRNVLSEVKRLGRSAGIHIRLISDPVTAANRREYLDFVISVIKRSPHRAKIVFLDPDTGVSGKTANAKHVTPEDVSRVWETLRRRDWLVIYQHALRRHGWRALKRHAIERACGGAKAGTFTAPQLARDVAFFAVRKP